MNSPPQEKQQALVGWRRGTRPDAAGADVRVMLGFVPQHQPTAGLRPATRMNSPPQEKHQSRLNEKARIRSGLFTCRLAPRNEAQRRRSRCARHVGLRSSAPTYGRTASCIANEFDPQEKHQARLNEKARIRSGLFTCRLAPRNEAQRRRSRCARHVGLRSSAPTYGRTASCIANEFDPTGKAPSPPQRKGPDMIRAFHL